MNIQSKFIIEGNLVLPDQIKYGQLVICNEYIKELVFDNKYFQKPDFLIDTTKYVSPGFVDIQINGGFGKDFKIDEDAIQVVSDNIYKYGTTSFCATIPTSRLEVYYFHSIKMVENFNYNGKAKFLGFHNEGPLLNPERTGAHDPAEIIKASDIDFDHYINDHTKIVTIAPEVENSKEIIKKLLKKKLKIGIGHSNATHNELLNVLDEENMIVIHLFNVMSQMNSKDPGIVGSAFANENIWVSIIADGIHIHPASLKSFWKARQNKNRIVCISDASPVTGLEEGIYKLGERVIERLNDRANLDNGKLVGSIFSLDTAIRNLIYTCQCSLIDAVNTVSLNPVKFLGLENEIGQIKNGNKADLVILNSEYQVEKTFIEGKLVYNSSSQF